LECSSLESIKIPYGIETIEKELFSGCKNLSEVIIPDSVKEIYYDAFFYCENLQSINIPNSVQTIGSSAFYACPKLTSIRIPDSVTKIYLNAFGYSKDVKIENFTIRGYKNSAAETYAKENDFNFIEICPNENMVTQVVKPTYTEYGYTIYTCKDCGDTYLADFTPALNHNFEVISETDATCTSTGAIKYKCRVCGYEYTKTLPKLPHTYEESIQDGKFTLTCTDCGHLYPLGEGTERIKSGDYHYTILSDGTVEIIRYVGTDNKVVIPNTIDCRKVTSISSIYSDSKDKIESIVIPDGVKSIGRNAFSHLNSLCSVIIPESVQTIGDYAFYNCTKLSSIVIPDGVTSIGEYAFDRCETLESITLSSSVTSIGAMAFGNCWKLKNVRIPKSVTNIGDYAFGFLGEYYDENDVVFYEKISNFTIHGFKGTAAETYAKFHGFSFVQTSCTHNNMTTQVVEPTCTEAGYTRYTCNDCGYTYKADYTDALGHDNEIISKTDSTCTSTGSIDYKCKVCGYEHT
jgi:rubredoxin